MIESLCDRKEKRICEDYEKENHSIISNNMTSPQKDDVMDGICELPDDDLMEAIDQLEDETKPTVKQEIKTETQETSTVEHRGFAAKYVIHFIFSFYLFSITINFRIPKTEKGFQNNWDITKEAVSQVTPTVPELHLDNSKLPLTTNEQGEKVILCPFTTIFIYFWLYNGILSW